MIETALRALLLASPGVSTLVGARVYMTILPPAVTYPAVTYQIVSGESHYSHQGPSDLGSPRVQVDCYAETDIGVLALRDAVMAALSGFKGHAGSPPVIIQGVFRAMERDGYEGGLARAGPRLWRKSIDFNVWFEESF
jgi:hypothetical protein